MRRQTSGQDMRASGSKAQRMVSRNGDTKAAEDLMKARKKEMEEDLEEQLKQLDGERKEGLYRLDWELAEAIEALHARHAERANKMISQHKQTISQLEKRAQAGEQMTPEKVQSMQAPMHARAPAQAPISRPLGQIPRSESTYSYYAEEESEEESEAESDEDETAFGKINNFLGMIRDEFLTQSPVQRRPKMDHQMYMNGYYMNGHAPAMNGHGPPNGHLPNGHLPNGALGSPEMINGISSTMTHPYAQGAGFPSPEMEMPPELPFANGQGSLSFDEDSPFSQGNLMRPPDLPTLTPLAPDWSPSAVGVSPEMGMSPGLINSFGQMPSSPQPPPMRPNWPPANVYHSGGIV